MIRYAEAIKNIIDSHAVSKLFVVNIVEYSGARVALTLTVDGDKTSLDGALGCVMDCIARVAGYSAIGNCVVSEYELNSRFHVPLSNLLAQAQIDSATKDFAIYHCSISTADGETPAALAQCSGTLVKSSGSAAGIVEQQNFATAATLSV